MARPSFLAVRRRDRSRAAEWLSPLFQRVFKAAVKKDRSKISANLNQEKKNGASLSSVPL